MTLALDILTAACLVVGGVFGVVGSYGLVRLKDAMQRLHAPTKATTLGVGGVLLASVLHFARIDGGVSFHEVLIAMFLFLTAPVTANFIAKAHMHRNVRPEDLPSAAGNFGWAGYDDPPEDRTHDLTDAATRSDNRRAPEG